MDWLANPGVWTVLAELSLLKIVHEKMRPDANAI